MGGLCGKMCDLSRGFFGGLAGFWVVFGWFLRDFRTELGQKPRNQCAKGYQVNQDNRLIIPQKPNDKPANQPDNKQVNVIRRDAESRQPIAADLGDGRAPFDKESFVYMGAVKHRAGFRKGWYGGEYRGELLGSQV